MAFSEGQTLDNTLGSLFLGSVFAAVLYGITSLQAYWYYHAHYRRDLLLHRISVGLLWALDSIHLFLIAHGVYHYCVTGSGNIQTMFTIVWSLKLQVTINVVIILIVQGLYTYRVYLLGGYHKSPLAYFVIAIVAGGFAIGIVLAHEVYTITTFDENQEIGWAIIASLATATIVDFIIAGAMCYYLRKSKGPQSRLNSNISTMSQFVLGSGFLTSAFSTAALISYLTMPHTLIYIGIESILTKLYINSFFAMLNARDRRRAEIEPRLSVRIPSLGKIPALPSTISVNHHDDGSSATDSDKALVMSPPRHSLNQRVSWNPPTSPPPVQASPENPGHPYPW